MAKCSPLDHGPRGRFRPGKGIEKPTASIDTRYKWHALHGKAKQRRLLAIPFVGHDHVAVGEERDALGLAEELGIQSSYTCHFLLPVERDEKAVDSGKDKNLRG